MGLVFHKQRDFVIVGRVKITELVMRLDCHSLFNEFVFVANLASIHYVIGTWKVWFFMQIESWRQA